MCAVPEGETAVCHAGTSLTQPQSNWTVPPKLGSTTCSTPLALDLGRELDDREHRRAGALGDGHRVAQVVAVPVREQDHVGGQLVGASRPPSGCRSATGRRARRPRRRRGGRRNGPATGRWLPSSCPPCRSAGGRASKPTAAPIIIVTRISSAISVCTACRRSSMSALPAALAPAHDGPNRTSAASLSAILRMRCSVGALTATTRWASSSCSGSVSAWTAASTSASVYARRPATDGHHTNAMAVSLTSLSHGAGCGCKLSAADLRPIVAASTPPPTRAFSSGTTPSTTRRWCGSATTRRSCRPSMCSRRSSTTPTTTGGSLRPTRSPTCSRWAASRSSRSRSPFRADLPADDVNAILRGGADVANAAGAPILGGHTITTAEPLYGLAVTGLVHPDGIWRNAGARIGDVLVLTKALGTGIVANALRKGAVSDDVLAAAVASMTALNRAGAAGLRELGPHAVTDVTGFGLLGHLRELCSASGVHARIASADLPLLPGVEEMARAGLVPGGSQRNRDAAGAYRDRAGRRSRACAPGLRCADLGRPPRGPPGRRPHRRLADRPVGRGPAGHPARFLKRDSPSLDSAGVFGELTYRYWICITSI